jgi:hypothetical protein
VPDPESAARGSLRRSLAFYSVLLAFDLLVIYYVVSSGVHGGGYITIAVTAIIGALLAYQVWTHIRDLSAPLIETEGVIERKWSRADLIIAWHSYYLMVGRAVFKVSPQDYVLVDENMAVRIVHFPRTLNVVSVQEIRRPKPLPRR